MSSTIPLGTLLKVQQFIHDNEVTVKKTSECNHVAKCICMIAMAVFSFPSEPSYISGKIVHVISEKTNHIA